MAQEFHLFCPRLYAGFKREALSCNLNSKDNFNLNWKIYCDDHTSLSDILIIVSRYKCVHAAVLAVV